MSQSAHNWERAKAPDNTGEARPGGGRLTGSKRQAAEPGPGLPSRCLFLALHVSESQTQHQIRTLSATAFLPGYNCPKERRKGMSQGLRSLLSWTASTRATDHSDGCCYSNFDKPKAVRPVLMDLEPSRALARTAQIPGISTCPVSNHSNLVEGPAPRRCPQVIKTQAQFPHLQVTMTTARPQATILQFHTRTDVGTPSDGACDKQKAHRNHGIVVTSRR